MKKRIIRYLSCGLIAYIGLHILGYNFRHVDLINVISGCAMLCSAPYISEVIADALAGGESE